MKKTFYYIFKGLKIFLLILVLLYVVIFAYVSANKKKIIKEVTAEMSSKLNGNVKIGNVELSFFTHFPKVDVLLNDVSLTDTLFAQHHHTFFQAKKVFINLSILKLIQRKSALSGILVQNGSIYLYTDSSGYTNMYLTHPKQDKTKKAATGTSEISLKTIDLENVRIILDDRKRQKLHDFVVDNLKVKLTDTDKEVSLAVKAEIAVKSLAFNLPRGVFLKDKSFSGVFDMQYDKSKGRLWFDSINVKIQGIPLNLTGSFDLQGAAPQFSLRVHIRQQEYAKIQALLPQRIIKSLSIVSLDKPLDADAVLRGPLTAGDPFVRVNWLVKNSHLATPFLDFDNASFTGYFKNEVIPGRPRTDPNSVINIENFKASWQNLPVTANNINILNLEVPLLTCNFHSAFPLKSLNDIIATNSLQLTSGDAEMEMTYQGPIEKNNNTNSFLNGNLKFKNGTVLYVPRNVELKAVNGNIIFKNSDVFIQNLQCDVLNNKIVMDGTAKNVLTLINTEPNKVQLNWNIYSPQLNLGSFIFLFKTPGSQKSIPGKGNKKYEKMSNQIDGIIEQSSINVSVKADKVFYQKFAANNLSAELELLQDRYLMKNISMDLAGGKMNMNGQLLNNQNNYHIATFNANLSSVDVTKIFYAFDNFGQSGITSANLAGLLTAKVNTSLAVNDDGKVLPSSVTGTVDFSLKKGALNNYEPIKKIQDFIFKKRDFDNISFAELKDRLDIKKGEIMINRMEIQSSVLSLFVEGTFSQKGNTDLSIQVPLSNLKKRGDDYKAENIGVNKKAGRSIFLRGRLGSDGNVNFKLDIFNRYKKDKNEAVDSSQ